jgi:uncharacterized protein (TIGR03663 family)
MSKPNLPVDCSTQTLQLRGGGFWQFVKSKDSRLGLLLYFFLILTASLARIYLLELRPLHHDEGVNFHFLRKMEELGFYPYSHRNYHGPAYFYFTWNFFNLFGQTEAALRASVVFFGVLATALPLMIWRSGWWFINTAVFLLGFSASALYYSRYAIHETSFLFWSLLLALATYRYIKERDSLFFYLAMMALGFMIATKETWIITLCGIGLGGLFISRFTMGLKDLKLVDYVIGLLLSLVVILFFYTGYFRNLNGIQELYLGIPQWVGRNSSDTGHFKPALYYIEILLGSSILDYLKILGLKYDSWKFFSVGAEPQFLVVALLILVSFIKLNKKLFTNLGEHSLLVFCTIWAVFMLIVYSVPIQYKTPWLVGNIAWPFYLLAAASVAELTQKNNFKLKTLSAVIIIPIVFLTLKNSYHFNYQVTYGRENPLAYVHAHQGVRDIACEAISYLKKNPTAKVLIAVRSYWPLPYYLREYRGQLSYVNNTFRSFERYGVLILEKNVPVPAGYYSKYFRLSDNQEVRIHFRLP